MKYVTLMVDKKVLDKREFETEDEAIDYFDGRFGDIIRKKMERQIKLLENRLPKYSDTYTDYHYVIKQRERLELLRKSLNEKPVRYENKYEPWNNQQLKGEDRVIYHVGSICRKGARYQVVEEEHYVRVDDIEFEGNVEALYDLLKKEHKTQGRFLYIFSGFMANERAIEQIKKLRIQIIREYRKDHTRL